MLPDCLPKPRRPSEFRPVWVGELRWEGVTWERRGLGAVSPLEERDSATPLVCSILY